ncbi:hypothetical protein LG634_14785 [Streptomyces bambusae]|uniref:hypothetical protein n=1 Tax=Streptomyces bambusae TaxID=1550616 RepID=UPI001CFE8214|nr:hypothetical protein [Streptomyces bambusae]MCB5166097.1 hypothetical protein [Streptomyces bambusae]
MTTHQTPGDPDQTAKLRRASTVAFLVGAAASLAAFAFLPGLPHVIDWGAILVSLAVGALIRWAYRTRSARVTSNKP